MSKINPAQGPGVQSIPSVHDGYEAYISGLLNGTQHGGGNDTFTNSHGGGHEQGKKKPLLFKLAVGVAGALLALKIPGVRQFISKKFPKLQQALQEGVQKTAKKAVSG